MDIDQNLIFLLVHVEDGESGEATLLQMRAKLFAIESKETGWKERGVGTLKVNVPKACASFDENGVAIPGSFDASGLEDEEEDYAGPRVPRLIMRQENTHRVVLNTIIVRAMEFKDKPSASSAQILFTAFEGEKPINMLLKVNSSFPSTLDKDGRLTLYRCRKPTPGYSDPKSTPSSMNSKDTHPDRHGYASMPVMLTRSHLQTVSFVR